MRASIITSKFTTRHEITDWGGVASGETWRKLDHNDKLLPAKYVHNLSKEDTTLAEAMKNAGYITFFAGKWYLDSKDSWSEDHGFDINRGGWESNGSAKTISLKGRGYIQNTLHSPNPDEPEPKRKKKSCQIIAENDW